MIVVATGDAAVVPATHVVTVVVADAVSDADAVLGIVAVTVLLLSLQVSCPMT